jgi:division/cell wall cluster transcriptional repressor MraZ
MLIEFRNDQRDTVKENKIINKKMALFIGEYRSKIDVKNRIVFPAAFKNELFAHAEKRLVVRKDFYEKRLLIYTVEAWSVFISGMKNKLNLLNKEHAEFWRTFMNHRAEVTPDEISGRIIIPRRLLDMIDVVDEVVFTGMDDYIELCCPKEHESTLMNIDEYAKGAEKYFGQIL